MMPTTSQTDSQLETETRRHRRRRYGMRFIHIFIYIYIYLISSYRTSQLARSHGAASAHIRIYKFSYFQPRGCSRVRVFLSPNRCSYICCWFFSLILLTSKMIIISKNGKYVRWIHANGVRIRSHAIALIFFSEQWVVHYTCHGINIQYPNVNNNNIIAVNALSSCDDSLVLQSLAIQLARDDMTIVLTLFHQFTSSLKVSSFSC